ncbi:MAG: hypothetical protein KF775_06995 [Cyclobacteriaceae bacterium]|nr:hypothetical protein [Cyclobacteriaceae bacterium]
MRYAFIYHILVLVLLSVGAHSQTGTYYLSHFTPPDDRIDFRSHFMLQDKQGELYFTNRQGILEFDGKNWNEIFVPGAVNAVAAHQAELYVAGVAGGGKLTKKFEADRQYAPLLEGNYTDVVSNGAEVYFMASNKVVCFSPTTQQPLWTAQADAGAGQYLGLLKINNQIYVRTARGGLLAVQNQKLVPADFTPANPLFIAGNLVGTTEGRLFMLSGNTPQEIPVADKSFLEKNTLLSGAWINDNLIALGTRLGGVIFINPKTGATEQIVDYQGGLPDNEIYALIADGNQGVWVAHEYGFTRIAPQVPFRSFHHYPGLTGNLLCAQTHEGKIFIGTTQGLFILTDRTSAAVSTDLLRSRKPIPQPDPPAPVYEYKRIAGIEGKVTQLMRVNNKLIAAGISGLYEINETSKLILPHAIRTVFYSRALQQVVVATPQQTLTLEPQTWKPTHLLDSIPEAISHVFEDGVENVWLCGKTHIYKIETVDEEITDIETLPIANPSQDETVGLGFGNEVYVAASGQFSIYDHKNSFVKFDSLPGPRKYFASGGSFWFHDGTRWRTVDKRVQGLRLEWLGLFPNLRYLAPDQNASLWVITATNELYRFSTSETTGNSTYPLFLREVRGQEISLAEQIVVEQNEGAVVFEFIQPAYLGLNGTQYRYQVKGLSVGWSPWSASNNEIAFSYLPPGKYQLLVQARDLLGTESKAEQIPFKVLPPYWKRWWFYALEFAIFSLLVVVSVRLGRANARYRVISQILSLLTIVMLIQFLQTAISILIGIKTSPVIEFIIQVFVALAIFPVEIFARDAMMKYVEGKYRIRHFWDKDK